MRALRRCFLVALVTVAACGDGQGAPVDGSVQIMATTSVWADITRAVACGDATKVSQLIPTGADPHAFEASLADRAELEGADLVVVNGLNLEESLLDTLDAVAGGGTPMFAAADAIEPLQYASLGDDHDEHGDDDEHGDEAEDGHDEHGHEGADPHIWFDPVRVATIVPGLAEAVVAAGADPAAVEQCADDYVATLTALHADIEALVETVPPSNRKLVTNHDALGYFAVRYGFEVVGTVLPTPSGLAEATPGQLQELAERIEAEGVLAIFAEAQRADDDAVALADAVEGVSVVMLDTGSLGAPGSGVDTYVDLMSSTAEQMVTALGGQG